MKAGWALATLGAVAQVGAGNSAPQGDAFFADGTHPFFRTSDAGRVRFGDIEESSDYLNDAGIKGLRRFPAGTILFPKSGASTFLNHRVMLGVDGYVSSHLATIVGDEAKVNRRFLLYFLSTIFAQDLIQDHSYPSLNLPMIAGIPVTLPSLPEQQRIVTLLDEAFDGIAAARAHAEKNLQNARAIFDRHLESLFSGQSPGWSQTTVGEQLTLQRGFDITKNQQRDGTVPVVSSGGIKSFHDTPMAKAPGVVIGRKGTLGKTYYLGCDYWPHDTTLWVKDFKGNVPRFVYYLLLGLNVKHLDSGAANPALNRNQVHPLKISWPPLSQQDEFTLRLDSLGEETQRLESLYQRKLTALDELTKSLLDQAFSGAL